MLLNYKRHKHNFLPFKHAVRSAYAQLILLPIVYIFILIHFKRKDSFKLIICNHLGDFLLTMGYADAFRKQKQLEHVTIVAAEKYREIFEMFHLEHTAFQSISDTWLKRMEEVNCYVSGKLAYGHLGDLLFVAPANDFVMGFEYALSISKVTNFTLKDALQFGNLGLDASAEYAPIHSRSFTAAKTKKLLFCPDAQMISWKENTEFFEKLRKKAITAGYETFVNNQDIYWPLREFFEKCNEFQAIIGLRSGLLDLAAYSGVRTIAIYPPEYEKYMSFYDIKKMNPDTHGEQYLITGNFTKDSDKILRMCEV